MTEPDRQQPNADFRVGDFTVLPQRGEISRNGKLQHVEPKIMAILDCLAKHQGNVVSRQQLIDAAWNSRAVSDEVIARAISTLRGYLGDNSKSPLYIRTVPKLGYELIASVGNHPEHVVTRPTKQRPIVLVVLVAIAALVAGLFWQQRAPNESPMGSIAVLPFTNLSDSADQYLVDGLTQELTLTLANNADLRVVANSSVTQFREQTIDVRALGELIDVDGVLEGSLRREGAKLRATVQLIDTNTGYHIWAETFDGSANDVFALQQRVAEAAAAVFGQPTLQVHTQNPKTPVDEAAYDQYLRGRYAMSLRGHDALRRAIGFFKNSISLDQSYGPAYIDLANVYLLMPNYDEATTTAMYEQAIATINEGTLQDPAIRPSAAAVAGFIHQKRGEWRSSARAFGLALESQPVPSTTHEWYSHFLASVGRLADARNHAQLARQRDPLSGVVASRLAILELWLGNNDRANEYFSEAAALGFNEPKHLESRLLLLVRQQRFADARALAVSLSSSGTDELSWIDTLFSCLETQTQCSAAASALAQQDNVSPRVALVAWALLGNWDRAWSIAERLVSDRDHFEPELLYIEELHSMRNDPRFTKLAEEIGLQSYWETSNCSVGSAVTCEPALQTAQ